MRQEAWPGLLLLLFAAVLAEAVPAAKPQLQVAGSGGSDRVRIQALHDMGCTQPAACSVATACGAPCPTEIATTGGCTTGGCTTGGCKCMTATGGELIGACADPA